MSVFNPSKSTSKCRVVYLSNLGEKGPGAINHNQAMDPGPNLNRKIATALILLRFDKYIYAFDVKKAFLQLKISDSDSSKLLFYWIEPNKDSDSTVTDSDSTDSDLINSIKSKDYKIIVFRMLRLPFGLVCSAFNLMSFSTKF